MRLRGRRKHGSAQTLFETRLSQKWMAPAQNYLSVEGGSRGGSRGNQTLLPMVGVSAHNVFARASSRFPLWWFFTSSFRTLLSKAFSGVMFKAEILAKCTERDWTLFGPLRQTCKIFSGGQTIFWGNTPFGPLDLKPAKGCKGSSGCLLL